MLEKIVLLLLGSKSQLLVALKGPALASLFVIGSTGFVVSGTIDGNEVDLVVRPLETKTCVDVLVAQTEALLEVDALARDGRSQLRRLREREQDRAEELRKRLDEAALRAAHDASSQAIRDALSTARRDVLAAADLSKCQDGDADTGVSLDLADLRARYDRIVRDLAKKVKDTLDATQAAFDTLVANAPPDPDDDESDGSGSGSDSRE